MRQITRTLHLVLKEEVNPLKMANSRIRDSIIHVGLGHSVFEVDERNKQDLLELLEQYPTERYYFRMSFVENLSESTGSARSYMTHDGKFFKPKVSGKTLYFLGLNFVIVEVERLDRSENFKVDNYRCTIKKYTTDPVTGDVTEETLWEKTKFGRVENYLPSKLKEFSVPVYQCRRRLSLPNRD